ncbi:MAG TPA: pilus assembly protein TadG-related protein [Azospirillaceae bacterium]|nr:pilus assembly protein TadG-related protein [Azospirillaceae bacterium]
MAKRRPWAALGTDTSGVVGILFALALPILVGFTGLGIEVGLWYLDRRETQMAADAAAVSAAFEALRQSDESTITTAARQEAARHGVNAAIGVFEVNHPPLSGPNTDNIDAVEVRISQPRNLLLARLFLGDSIDISARAVAIPNPSGTACVLSLDANAAGAVTVSGNGTIDMPGCVVAANSNDDQAIELTGSGTLKTQTLSTPGGFNQIGGSSTLSTTEALRTRVQPLANPYADLNAPAVGACEHNSYAAGGGGGHGGGGGGGSSTPVSLSPGTYCNGMSFGSQAQVDFAPGTYVVAGGQFQVSAGATLACGGCTSGDGVTFILTSNGTGYAQVRINGNASIDLRAPNHGSYAGLLFFQDPAAPTGGTNYFNGNATMKLHGALYFPHQSVDFSGNSSIAGAACTQIVAATVVFSGASTMGSNCTDSGVTEINAGGTVNLVE